MEVKFSHLSRNGSWIALTSALGFILPFLVGVIGAYWLPLGAYQTNNPLEMRDLAHPPVPFSKLSTGGFDLD